MNTSISHPILVSEYEGESLSDTTLYFYPVLVFVSFFNKIT